MNLKDYLKDRDTMEDRGSLISVIVCIYNVEQYLPQCLESIIRQTYKNLEIILIDDGSFDQSGKICDYYQRQDCRIKVIHKSNGGLVKARKSGLYHATGNYVIFVDGDDYIEENLCECMYLAIKNKDVDFVHANFYENESKICNGIKEKKIYILF